MPATSPRSVLSSLLALAVPLAATAAVVPDPSPLQSRAFRHPDLAASRPQEDVRSLEPALASRLKADLAAMKLRPDAARYDSRGGRWSSLILSEPMVPGTGLHNDLRWSHGAKPAGEAALQAEVWNALKAYLARNRASLRVDVGELESTPRIGIFEKGDFIAVYARRMLGGVPVREGGLSATLNHGNLILLGLRNWGDAAAPAPARIGSEQARALMAGHVRPFTVRGLRRQPHLELVPTTSGAAYEYRLAWVVLADVEGDLGTWEALVDAHSGEILSFQDTNRYAARKVVGGVYPVSNDQRPPDGEEQPGWPMPYADAAGFTDSGGNVTGCATGNITTRLSGQFVRMSDACGSINEFAAAADLDLGSGPGTDCTVPPGRSLGNTHASRSAYYQLNRIQEQARGYLPGNTWLRNPLRANVNVNQTCNAFWDGGTVNFFRDNGGSCRNTGEIAGVLDHEWGHGMDNNGVNPELSSPGEAIADIHAILHLDTSCVGRGFFKTSVCSGFGDACTGTPETGCTGVRDSDFANHRCNLPHGINWIVSGFTTDQCPSGAAPACGEGGSGGRGPCNRETHCEGQVGAEVVWDLHFRDLQATPFNLDPNTALELTTRLTYLASQSLTDWYECSVGGGCGATSGYMLYLAADDDNGSLDDGTPHMTAIRAAFERHEIHCASPAAVDSGCAGGPTEAPTVTATPGAAAANLSWTAVPGASSYQVYRTDGVAGCSSGKVKVGDVATTSFVDAGLQEGRPYHYAVLPMGANTSCFGGMSACATVTPNPPPDPCLTVSTVSFGEAGTTQPENGFPFTFVGVAVTTFNGLPTTAPVTVQFATLDGTATAGSDYTAAFALLTFPPGTASGVPQMVMIPLINDSTPEPSETFLIALFSPAGAILGGIQVHTVTITDDDDTPPPPPVPFVRGDFNGDGQADLLWRQPFSGKIHLWYMNGADRVSEEPTTPSTLPDPLWRIVGTHDFNADGKNDILWRRDGSGENALWFMNGSVLTGSTLLTPTVPDRNWKVVGTGLFDGDSKPDIVWHHETSGRIALWYMNGSVHDHGTFTTPPSLPDTNWRLQGVADFSTPPDGKPDFVWRHRVTGELRIWFMNDHVKTGETATTPSALTDTRWELVAIGDYNRDLKNDLVWRHAVSGHVVIWFMDGPVRLGGTLTNPAAVPDPRWRIVGPR